MTLCSTVRNLLIDLKKNLALKMHHMHDSIIITINNFGQKSKSTFFCSRAIKVTFCVMPSQCCPICSNFKCTVIN